MHLFENALRISYIERHAAPGALVIIDNIFPITPFGPTANANRNIGWARGSS
jgi:hypothetical protein